VNATDGKQAVKVVLRVLPGWEGCVLLTQSFTFTKNRSSRVTGMGVLSAYQADVTSYSSTLSHHRIPYGPVVTLPLLVLGSRLLR